MTTPPGPPEGPGPYQQPYQPPYQQPDAHQQPAYQQPVYQQPVYQQPAYSLPNPPGAVAGLVLGIISVVTCGVPTGPFAIWQSRVADRAIKESPAAYGNKGLVTAGLVLGIIGTVLLALWILYWIFIILLAIGTSSS